MANTVIQLKYSTLNSSPTILSVGEPAYSFQSNKLFIGNSTNHVLTIGGKYYVDIIEAATSAATANTLVLRDATGNASFNFVTANIVGSIVGNAESATKLQTPRFFNFTGDIDAVSVSFDGTANADFNLQLDNTGVSSGVVGGPTQIPVLNITADGRIIAASNTSISTDLNIAADTGSNVISLSSDTLKFVGGDGITTSIGPTDNVRFDVDNTVFRTTGGTIDGNVSISGNLTVLGNTTSVNVSTLSVDDSLIALARNNSTDVVDIGFYGHYIDGSNNRHAGIFRNAGNKQFYVFDNYDQEPTANVINPSDPSFRLATLHTNLTANIANANTLYVANRIYGDTTNNTIELIPSISYGPGVNDQYIIVDPTTPNHIHVRAGGAIDASTAELYLGGELTNVQVSDNSDSVYVRANNKVWTFADSGKLYLPNNAEIYDDATTIFIDSSETNITGNLTANGSATFESNVFAPNLPNVRANNLVYYDSSNGRFSYADDNALTPTSIANGVYVLGISGTDGTLSTNGEGFLLNHGAIIKDTAGDAVVFGQNAGVISQGNQAVAIGDAAGYNTQGAYGVAIGYGAGNQSQGQAAIAIGINAGLSNQGTNGIALGNSSGLGQGQNSVALGYDSGGMQGNFSVAIGHQAGKGNTTAIGVNTIAIGNRAGFESAAANSVILNATGSNLISTTEGFFVSPVRYTASQDSTDDGFVFYNQSTKEFRYSFALSGGTF